MNEPRDLRAAVEPATGLSANERVELMTEFIRLKETLAGVDVDFDSLLERRQELRTQMESPHVIDYTIFTLRRKVENRLQTELDERMDARLDQFDHNRSVASLGRFFRDSYHEQFPFRPRDEYFRSIIQTIVKRITAETQFADKFQDLLELDHLVDLEQFVKSQSDMQADDLEGKASGRYSRRTDRIRIENMNVDDMFRGRPDAVLQDICTLGSAWASKTMMHERIHRAKYSDAPNESRKPSIGMLDWIGIILVIKTIKTFAPQVYAGKSTSIVGVLAAPFMDRYHKLLEADSTAKENKVLSEVAAYRGDRMINERTPYDIRSFIEILSKPPYELNAEKLVDQMIIGVQQIDRLMALGMSHTEIGALVRKAEWSGEAVSYALLDEVAGQLALKRGLQPAQVDGLVDAMWIQRDIDLLKVRLIAQQELRKAYEEEGLQWPTEEDLPNEFKRSGPVSRD